MKKTKQPFDYFNLNDGFERDISVKKPKKEKCDYCGEIKPIRQRIGVLKMCEDCFKKDAKKRKYFI